MAGRRGESLAGRRDPPAGERRCFQPQAQRAGNGAEGTGRGGAQRGRQRVTATERPRPCAAPQKRWADTSAAFERNVR
eukprot:CAMPEP_0202062788 /NCGR_PEP_ID=MMETSP0963-20130614/44786_1 /ASSEMBLY_ACC=CAM_ASM_000494 /TAXON_ID=4773 /ORGANISM="Schizochytrium aggregatum, Strain ATCC28209" /LENGTH=77 /DNA_ID=CAMNT_0048629123 /DNA_START=102 /DNA_END=331 /DNA_ORIENTATION=+